MFVSVDPGPQSIEEIKDNLPLPHECKFVCPVCQKMIEKNREKGTNFRTPLCLEHPELLPPSQKHLCAFSCMAGRAIIGGAQCDLCGEEIAGQRFIVNVHPEPKPTVAGMYVCKTCLAKPENAVLRRQMG